MQTLQSFARRAWATVFTDSSADDTERHISSGASDSEAEDTALVRRLLERPNAETELKMIQTTKNKEKVRR